MSSMPTFFGAVRQFSRGKTIGFPYGASGMHRFPTDPVGTHVLTLTNVVIGSRIAIRDQANTTTLYDQVASSSTVVISLSAYAAGAALNNWRIKIRKGSGSPNYIPYETLTTAFVGSSTIYVSQIPDE